MLMDIKALLQQREQMTLTDLARHFYVSELVMLSMLEKWKAKGNIQTIELGEFCGTSCGSCDEPSENKVLYKWRQTAQKSIYTQAK